MLGVALIVVEGLLLWITTPLVEWLHESAGINFIALFVAWGVLSMAGSVGLVFGIPALIILRSTHKD